MLVQVACEDDLPKVEEGVRLALGAQRFDVSVLRSKPYIDLRRALLCVLGGGDCQGLPGAFYFHKEDLVLRIVQKQPLLVWVGFREMEIYENED
jgi:hypothetical protein